MVRKKPGTTSRTPLHDVSRNASHNNYSNSRSNNSKLPSTTTNRSNTITTNTKPAIKTAQQQIPNYLRGTRSSSNKRVLKKNEDNDPQQQDQQYLKQELLKIINELNIAKEDTIDRTLFLSQKMKEFNQFMLHDNNNINNHHEINQNSLNTIIEKNNQSSSSSSSSSLLSETTNIDSYEKIIEEQEEEIQITKNENEKLTNLLNTTKNNYVTEVNTLKKEIEERKVADVKARQAINIIHEKTSITIKRLEEKDEENIKLANELNRTIEELSKEKLSNASYENCMQDEINNLNDVMRSKDVQIKNLVVDNEEQQKIIIDNNNNNNNDMIINNLKQLLQNEKNEHDATSEQLLIMHQTLSSIEHTTSSIIDANQHEIESLQQQLKQVKIELKEQSALANKFQWREKEMKKIVVRTKSDYVEKFKSLELEIVKLEDNILSANNNEQKAINNVDRLKLELNTITDRHDMQVKDATIIKNEYEKNINSLEFKLTKYEAESINAHSELASLQQHIAMQSSIIEQLNDEIAEKTNKKNEYEEKMITSKSESLKSDALTTILREEVISKQNKISQQNAIVEQLNIEIEEILRTKFDYEEQLNNFKIESSKKIEDVTTNLYKYQEKNTYLEATVREHQGTIDNLNTYVEQMKVSVQNEWNEFSRRLAEEADIKIREKDGLIHNLNEQLQSYNNYIGQIQNEIAILRNGRNVVSPLQQQQTPINSQNESREQIENNALMRYMASRNDHQMMN